MAGDATISAMTLYCEASSASQMERVCVAHVIRNRVASGRWGLTAAAVCTAYEQFSSWNGDRQSRNNLMRVMRAPDNDPVLVQSSQAWDDSEEGTDPTAGATHYVDKTIPPPSWTVGATMTLETAKFRFYANVP